MGGGGDEFGDIGPDHTRILEKFDVSSLDVQASKRRVFKPGKRFARRRTVYPVAFKGLPLLDSKTDKLVPVRYPILWIDRNKRLIQKRGDGKYGYMSREDVNSLTTVNRWALYYVLTHNEKGITQIVEADCAHSFVWG